MTKSSNLVPKRYQPRKWPVGKKPATNIGDDFGAPRHGHGELRLDIASGIDDLLAYLRDRLPGVDVVEHSFTRGQMTGRSMRDIHPICFAFGEQTMMQIRSLDQGALNSAQAVFYRAKDRMAGFGTAEDVATNEALREAVWHYVMNTEKLKSPAPMPKPRPQPEPLDPEAVSRRDAFLQAAAYHDAIVESWTKESKRAEAAYNESQDPKDLCDWEAASVNSANHYDFANDMRRMAEGVKPRNAPMEFAEQTQMGTWSGRLKNLQVASPAAPW